MIFVLFQTESHFPVNRKRIKELVADALGKKLRGSVEVGISIVGDRQMKALNRKYRNTEGTTDVLSFALSDPTAGEAPFVDPPDRILRLGDIIVSYPQAVAEASERNTLVDDIIAELVLHGLDHLLGIHHEE